MKYKVSWIERVHYSVVVEADTYQEAEELIEDGDFEDPCFIGGSDFEDGSIQAREVKE